MKAPSTRSRHGLTAPMVRVKLRGFGAIDRRMAGAREAMAFKHDLVAALGGETTLSPQRRRLVDLATPPRPDRLAKTFQKELKRPYAPANSQPAWPRPGPIHVLPSAEPPSRRPFATSTPPEAALVRSEPILPTLIHERYPADWTGSRFGRSPIIRHALNRLPRSAIRWARGYSSAQRPEEPWVSQRNGGPCCLLPSGGRSRS